tara:strand:- start:128 stop:1087 length:960 start_codon:yes stop_codon:yes gene_type:complete
MYLKKLFYKLTNKEKHFYYKNTILRNELIKSNYLKIFKSGIDKKIAEIHNNIQTKKELSFLHYGHLGDLVNSLSIVQELSKTHKCNFYVQANKPLGLSKNYKQLELLNKQWKKKFGDTIFLSDKSVDMVLPLLKKQTYFNKVEKYTNQEIDVDLNFVREMPLHNRRDDLNRWYSGMTGVTADFSIPYLKSEPHPTIKNKIVIIRTLKRHGWFINYKFLRNYKDLLFIGLPTEYDDLKSEIPNLEYYDCKEFLEMAQIIQSCKLFIGNLSLGFHLAEALKVPRLLEGSPSDVMYYPHGEKAYVFFFQEHFEKWFNFLNNS